ncbi:MAG: hypothetical protein BAJALOKI1v1_2020002 [Promethearchaeota archaeon]|nr:MAG: hypothetical protein BAJALOKI1v1_2020002 [Candidatus Lokiarchaeota archaeon]
MIKSIFIQKGNTGELIFYKTYEDLFDIKLTSSFLSAIFSFVKQTLRTEQLSEIEVGPFRFIFEIEKLGNDELLFALFADRTDNLVELRGHLKEIQTQFLGRFDETSLTHGFDGEITKFKDFEQNIENILENNRTLISEENKKAIMNIFEELHTFSVFVVSSGLITQTGRVVISYLEANVLSEIIRLLEGRFITGNYQINELISLEDFGILSLKGIDDHFISVILFKETCPFETSLLIAKKFSQRLRNLLM